MSSLARKIRSALVCALLLAIPALTPAQVSRGNVAGRVTDTAGAVIAKADVLAVETATGSVYKARSNADGDYTLPFLAPGTYRISISYSGFKSFVRENVIVGANEHVSADAQLAVGERSEVVSVSSDTTLLETSIASTGQVLDAEDIENMPVNGRTPLILGQLAYGAISTGNPQFNHPYDNSGPSSVALGGGASKKNELLMDGSPDGGADGTIAFSPPMDAVQEVKVETFQADAAYGHTSGGTVNQVTRSGANQYHGSAYEFLQNSALNDTNYFTKRTPGATKSVTRYNQYGGTIGGPIVIPKIFDGHDRLFFFFAYEGIKNNTPNPTVISVPTEAEKNGDFSALLALGSNYTIYDPTTGVRQGSRVVRRPFPNNIIPKSQLNAVGVKLASYFAAPNRPGLATGENNYYYPGNNIDRFDSELGRIDLNIGARNKLFYSYRHNDRYHESGNAFNNLATGSVLIQPNFGSTVDDVHTFTASTVWENRINWTRNTESRPLAATFDFSQLGFPPALVAASTQRGFPVTSGTKYVDYGYSKGDLIPFDSFQIFSTLSHVAGKHSMQFGSDLRLYKESSFRFGNSSGIYNFALNSGQGWTNGPLDNSAAAPIGQELASMLLGLPTAGSFDINTTQQTSAKYFAFFVQDNYRIASNLTLNLGLRYERDLATTERHNAAISGFDTSVVSPINAQAQANFVASPVAGVSFPVLHGGLTFAGPNNRSLYQTKADNFSPRLGFAWTPLQRMSVRGGMGIFNGSVGRVDPISPGFNQTTQVQATLDGYLTPAATLSNPFPSGLITPPGSSQGLSTNLGQSISYFPRTLLNDYAIRWDLDIQQQMPGNVLFEIGYVGEHGLHSSIGRNVDALPAELLSYGQSRDTTAVNNLTANVANPFRNLLPGTTLNGATVQKQQLLLPYPQYTGVTLSNNPAGYALFHELEARVEKRMSHGVRFLVNYSWSKRLEGASYLNPQDSRPEKRISADDRPQHLVATATWELPFGQGRRYAIRVPVAGYLASGWNLSSIYTYQPLGAPLVWGDVIYLGSNLNDLQVNPHAVDGAFDTSRFDLKSGDQPVAGTHIRTLPTQVTNARQDGINSMDLSLIKNNRITEGLRAQLRADFFNALNHPNFAAPNLTPTSSSFGKITSQANLPRTIQVGLRLAF